MDGWMGWIDGCLCVLYSYSYSSRFSFHFKEDSFSVRRAASLAFIIIFSSCPDNLAVNAKCLCKPLLTICTPSRQTISHSFIPTPPTPRHGPFPMKNIIESNVRSLYSFTLSLWVCVYFSFCCVWLHFYDARTLSIYQ